MNTNTAVTVGVLAVLGASGFYMYSQTSNDNDEVGQKCAQPSVKKGRKGKKEQNSAEKNQEPPYEQVKGIMNLGNTCFLNSVLQALSACWYFRSFLETTVVLSRSTPEKLALCGELLRCVRGETSDPTRLLSILAKETKKFDRLEQEDSHELFGDLIQTIDKEILALGFLENMQSMPFAGVTAGLLQCLVCGFHRPVKLSPSTCLSLPLPEKLQPVNRLDTLLFHSVPHP